MVSSVFLDFSYESLLFFDLHVMYINSEFLKLLQIPRCSFTCQECFSLPINVCYVVFN